MFPAGACKTSPGPMGTCADGANGQKKGTASLGGGARKLLTDLRFDYLKSTFFTVTTFLPSFSATVPVTVPSLLSVQIFLWLALSDLASK